MIECQAQRMIDSELRRAFEEHKDAIYRFTWRMTNSPAAAEDIAQDVFLPRQQNLWADSGSGRRPSV
jgi:DNA-directed RNA polymerase specialized sigma24 family protein